jgi:hypothetical protein
MKNSYSLSYVSSNILKPKKDTDPSRSNAKIRLSLKKLFAAKSDRLFFSAKTLS